jgi:hypothetical protein
MHNSSHPEYREELNKPNPIDTHENAIIAMREAKQKIPGDLVNQATADLPDKQRSAIRRLHAYYIENDLSLDKTGDLVHLAGGTLSLVFRGKYDANLDNVVSEIERFFELLDKRNQARKLPFIETSLTLKIWDVCATAVEFQKVGFIFGDGQIGKSKSLEEFKLAHNHGNTHYVAVPAGGSLCHFLAKLAEELRLSPALRETELRRRIIKSFDERMLLIVDEAHQCIPTSGQSQRGLLTLEFIRELYNEAMCGVVICATNVFRDAMEHGAMEKVLRQLKRRRLCSLQLNDKPKQVDLNAFSAAYHLPVSDGAARKLEAQMVENEALGMWLTLLRMAAKIAAQRKQQMEWSHVIQAHSGLKQLEGN